MKKIEFVPLWWHKFKITHVTQHGVLPHAALQVARYSPLVDNTESDSIVPSAADTEMIEYALVDESTGIAVANGQLPATGGTLDFAHLPAGTYIFRIISNNTPSEDHLIDIN